MLDGHFRYDTASDLRPPSGGIYKFNAGFDSIVGTPGFLCRSLRDVDLLHRLTLGAEPWRDDPSLLPLPWRREDTVWKGSNGRLKVGFMEHDGYIQPHPPILRGLRQLRAKLEQDPAFEVVSYGEFADFPPPSLMCHHAEGRVIRSQSLTSTRGETT